jgi:hypothetical protein
MDPIGTTNGNTTSINSLPSELLYVILARDLDWKWRFCARPVSRLWYGLCQILAPYRLGKVERSHTPDLVPLFRPSGLRLEGASDVVCASRAVSLFRETRDPVCVATWCISMGATHAQAAQVLVAIGGRAFIKYAASMPKAPDSDTMNVPPFARLTRAVAQHLGVKDAVDYIDRHPMVFGDPCVDTLCAQPESALSGSVARGRYDTTTRAHTATDHRAKSMAKAKRWILMGCFKTRSNYIAHAIVDTESAMHLLHSAAQFGVADAFGLIDESVARRGIVLDPLWVFDVIARSTATQWPRGSTLVRWFYETSYMGKALRPVNSLNRHNCPLVDPEAHVDPRVDLALLDYATNYLAGSHEAIMMIFIRLARCTRSSLHVAPNDRHWCAQRHAWMDAAVSFVNRGDLSSCIDWAPLIVGRRRHPAHRSTALPSEPYDDFISGRLDEQSERGDRWRRLV